MLNFAKAEPIDTRMVNGDMSTAKCGWSFLIYMIRPHVFEADGHVSVWGRVRIVNTVV